MIREKNKPNATIVSAVYIIRTSSDDDLPFFMGIKRYRIVKNGKDNYHYFDSSLNSICDDIPVSDAFTLIAKEIEESTNNINDARVKCGFDVVLDLGIGFNSGYSIVSYDVPLRYVKALSAANIMTTVTNFIPTEHEKSG